VPDAVWIGGPSVVGKTTVARRLARRYGLRLHSTDTRTWVHRDRALAAGSRPARTWESLEPAERWARPAEELLAMSLHAERGQMFIDDLLALPLSPLVVAEGTVLPAWAVPAGVVDRSCAIWLIPTSEFCGRQLDAAGRTGGQRALAMRLAEVIADEAARHRVPTLTLDGSLEVDEVTGAVEAHLAGALSSSRRATGVDERRALLREINLDVVAQVRGYYARPWADGDPEAVTRSFVCECGDPACLAEVNATVGEAARRPVASPGHRSRRRQAVRGSGASGSMP
jgi:hypothetical protein